MSKISGLSVKAKNVTIGGTELTLIPLSFKERDTLAKVLDAKEKNDQMEATFELIKKVLQKSYPDMTEDEWGNMSVEYIGEISKAVLELHGMKMSEADIKKLMADKALG